MRLNYEQQEKVEEVRAKLKAAFKELRNKDNRLVAKMNYLCCQSCASYAICSDVEEKGWKRNGYVFWHRQGNEGFRERGHVYLYFSGTEEDEDEKLFEKDSLWVANKVVEVLKKHEIDVEWDGNANVAILVKAI